MYKYVYMLSHARVVEYDDCDAVTDTKILGIFSSMSAVKDSIAFFSTLEGFRDYPDDYKITKKRIYLSGKSDVKTAYLIEYEKHLHDGIYEVSRLNIYSEYEDAVSYVEKQKSLCGFDPTTEDYEINEYTIDENSSYWGEGFN